MSGGGYLRGCWGKEGELWICGMLHDVCVCLLCCGLRMGVGYWEGNIVWRREGIVGFVKGVCVCTTWVVVWGSEQS
jgi:hypothetical protein